MLLMNPIVSLLTGGLFRGFDPTKLLDDPQKALEQLKNADIGPVKKVVAFAGKPIAVDLNKTDGVGSNKYWKEKKDAGWGSYLLALANRYVFCWGAVLGVATKIVDFFLGRNIQSDPDNAAVLVKFVKKLTGFAWWLCIGAAGYSQVTQANRKYYVDENEQLIARGENTLNETLTTLNNDELAKKDINSPDCSLRHSDDEKKKIREVVGDCQKSVKAFIVGDRKTGTTELMNSISGQIINYERNKRDVVVQNISGDKLVTNLLGVQKAGEENVVKSLVGQLTGQLGLGDVGAKPGVGLLSVMVALRKKLEDTAKDGGKRIVIQFDEVNALWSLAKTPDKKYDTGLVGSVVQVFKDICDKDYDVLFACNAKPNDPLGLAGVFSSQEEFQAVFQGDLGKWYKDVREKGSIPISLHNQDTKANIAAVYLMKLSQRLGVKPEQLFDDELRQLINDENCLTEELKKRLEQKFSCLSECVAVQNGQVVILDDQIGEKDNLNKFEVAYKEYIAFRQLPQGVIEDVINNDLNSTRESNPITLDMVVDSLVKKIELSEGELQHIQGQLQGVKQEQKKIAKDNKKRQAAITPNVKIAKDLIESLDDAQWNIVLTDALAKEYIKPFLDESILDLEESIRERHAKILVARIKHLVPSIA